MLLRSPHVKGKGQKKGFTKGEVGLASQNSYELLLIWREEAKPLFPTTFHQWVIRCGLGCPGRSMTLDKTAFFSAKAIPRKGWLLRIDCQQHSKATGGVNPSFQRGIWLEWFTTYSEYL
jgi:hypothetical protein